MTFLDSFSDFILFNSCFSAELNSQTSPSSFHWTHKKVNFLTNVLSDKRSFRTIIRFYSHFWKKNQDSSKFKWQREVGIRKRLVNGSHAEKLKAILNSKWGWVDTLSNVVGLLRTTNFAVDFKSSSHLWSLRDAASKLLILYSLRESESSPRSHSRFIMLATDHISQKTSDSSSLKTPQKNDSKCFHNSDWLQFSSGFVESGDKI